ncbi:MAG TPA: N-acetyl-gamma-glutamyl-phosphate reductase, partial [Acidobacteria bacterium]|nr:N-acetyl-gamma-glutamyl-phosphate reductase [Acidobacteriota bacterium]
MAELRAAVLGAAGYAGGELLRLLLGHPAVGEVRAFSASHAGRPLDAAHPALAHLPEGRFEAPDPAAAASWADVLFLALPHGRSQGVMAEILAADPALVIDLAADFRIDDDALYRRHYGEHAAPELRSRFVYALADVLGPRLEGRRRLAVPGCFATAALLGLWPLAAAGLMETPPVVFAVTGSTGSGAVPGEKTHHPARANNFFAYAS